RIYRPHPSPYAAPPSLRRGCAHRARSSGERLSGVSARGASGDTRSSSLRLVQDITIDSRRREGRSIMQALTSPHTTPHPSASIPTASDTPLPWYHFGGADVVFLVVALLVFLTARQGLLDDPGLGWHLRNIDAMLAQGGWLHVDP